VFSLIQTALKEIGELTADDKTPLPMSNPTPDPSA